MKILITGASSYVGAKLYVDLQSTFDVIGTYYSNKLFDELIKLDITNKSDVYELIDNVQPDYIIHVAANASGGWCEKNPDQAVALNQEGTRFIVDAANKINSKIIFISSFAAINPSAIYGKTKNESEKIIEKVNAGFVILRPSLILGYSPNTTNDRPFNRLLNNIKENKEVSYDISWKFQPTRLKHISEIVKIIIERNINNELIPIAIPKIITRYDYAKDILAPFHIKVIKENREDNTPCFEENLNKLKELDLPEYTYTDMIEGVIQEIKYNTRK